MRSRNAGDAMPIPVANASTIVFSDAGAIKKRRFLTTNSMSYQGLPVPTVSNVGILSHQYQIRRDAQAK